jgi:formate dehydrogenase subunit beta
MKSKVKAWLENGEVDLFLGYRMQEGHPLPHCFTGNKPEEIEDLVAGPALYPLEKMAAVLASERPEIRIGLLTRDCNQRALRVLFIWNQLDPDRVMTVDTDPLPPDARGDGDCSYPEPEERVHKKRVGMDNNMEIEDVERFNPRERFSRWMYEFRKCIKCYGCRNICPVCFCRACSLESPDLVKTGDLPPEIPIFHLIRAVHMAGRCVDCGLCEDACPADIPLRLLYRKVNEIVEKVFDYETGTSPEHSPFNVLGDKVTLAPIPIEAAEPREL